MSSTPSKGIVCPAGTEYHSVPDRPGRIVKEYCTGLDGKQHGPDVQYLIANGKKYQEYDWVHGKMVRSRTWNEDGNGGSDDQINGEHGIEGLMTSWSDGGVDIACIHDHRLVWSAKSESEARGKPCP